MTKSIACCHRELTGVALACVLCLMAGCAPKQAAPPLAAFNVAATPDGRTVVWWLRISKPDFTTMVHESAGKPQFGSVDALMHRKVDTLIAAGLIEHGLVMCDPTYRTVAGMKDGSVQFTGTCSLGRADLAVSRNGT